MLQVSSLPELGRKVSCTTHFFVERCRKAGTDEMTSFLFLLLLSRIESGHHFDEITLELTRIVIALSVFAVGVELPK